MFRFDTFDLESTFLIHIGSNDISVIGTLAKKIVLYFTFLQSKKSVQNKSLSLKTKIHHIASYFSRLQLFEFPTENLHNFTVFD